MKKWLCVLCCAALLLPAFTCALGEEAAAEFSTATALKAFLPTVDWDDYTAKDTDVQMEGPDFRVFIIPGFSDARCWMTVKIADQ